MLGIDVAKSTVERHMVKRPKPASPTWRAFLANHVACLPSIDFFTVPTVRNRVLHVFVVLVHLRRRVLHFAIIEPPTADWTSRQIIEAFPWHTALAPHVSRRGCAGAPRTAAAGSPVSRRRYRWTSGPAKDPRQIVLGFLLAGG